MLPEDRQQHDLPSDARSINESEIPDAPLQQFESRFGVAIDGSRLAIVAFDSEVLQRNPTLAQRIGSLGSWEWNTDRWAIFWSEEMYRIFGVSADSMLTYASIERLLHPDDRTMVTTRMREAFAGSDSAALEFRIVRPSGEVRHIVHAFEINRNRTGAPESIFGVVQDITERRQFELEQARLHEHLARAQQMEIVGRLAGGISHDLNNMLAAILISTQMSLPLVKPEEPLFRYLTTIQTAAQRSADLVQQLLGFARKQPIAPKVISLNAVVDETMPMLSKLVGEDINLTWLPGPSLWQVKIDPLQATQILVNLCTNARDAINGIGVIIIETENTTVQQSDSPDLKAGQYATLSVTDNGCGMDPDTLAHIFEPFFTTKDIGRGAGMGLATVEGMVHQNRGHIQVASEPNQGTTFRVFLPRFDEAAESYALRPQVKPGMCGETILLVEDEPAVLEMVAEVLNHLGYTVLATESPLEGIRLAQQHERKIDLLMTDIIMPEMNGREMADRILTIMPEVKLLFTSGYPDDAIARRGVPHGTVHFLHKPYSLQRLADKVREVLADA